MKTKILNILSEIQPAFNFEEDVDFVTRGYLDSFDIVQLVAELEDQFDVIISALDILPENFSSVESMCKLVSKSEKRS